jgi:ATP-dependent DNA helicase DinG
VTAVLTSATVPPLLEARLGLPADATDRLDVGSPFPYGTCALLYCATALPDRRSPGAEEAIGDELARLVVAAGGRTLALFTSWRAMQHAVDSLRPRLGFPVLAQNDLPKARLVEAFAAEEAACLFATMSFWQGIDVPGATLSLVAIDRIPFPRPDDPLLEARRERAGDAAFRMVDLPRAATLLAQGAGRLIRSATDAGVVAVLDRRLATAGYGRTLLAALPPMRLTTDGDEVVAFLEDLHARAEGRRAAPGDAQ